MKLSVLQWNGWYKEAADNILEFVRQTNADVVCLQELTRGSRTNPSRDLAAEIEALGYSSVYAAALERPAEQLVMGNGIFSKFPIIDSRQAHVQYESDDKNDYSKENRIYLEANLDINGAILRVGTVHLSYIPAFEINEAKRAEVDRLLVAIDKPTERFILTGDLNSRADSYTVAKLSEFLQNAGPEFTEPTWTTKPFHHQDFSADTLDWRLDYIFATPDLQTISSEIIKTSYSDHLPILATFEV